MSKLRLDRALLERGICDNIDKAKAMIMAGDVLVNDQRELQAGRSITESDHVTLRQKPRYVSRGGEKMHGALEASCLDVTGMVAADFGSSTGGFTDCLLQHGAAKVYAVDVGYGILDDRMRNHPNVISLERTNARHLDALPEPVDIVVIDVSFISLKLMFPAVTRVLKPGGICIPLIKPQFEADPTDVGKRGVVRDPAVHRQVLRDVLQSATDHSLSPLGLIASPLRGPNGNIEFLAHLSTSAIVSATDYERLIDRALASIPK